jgi:hypothetical protein
MKFTATGINERERHIYGVAPINVHQICVIKVNKHLYAIDSLDHFDDCIEIIGSCLVV